MSLGGEMLMLRRVGVRDRDVNKEGGRKVGKLENGWWVCKGYILGREGAGELVRGSDEEGRGLEGNMAENERKKMLWKG